MISALLALLWYYTMKYRAIIISILGMSAKVLDGFGRGIGEQVDKYVSQCRMEDRVSSAYRRLRFLSCNTIISRRLLIIYVPIALGRTTVNSI